MKFSILLLTLTIAVSSHAQWLFRPQAGIGYTSNANYEETEKNSDMFWWARLSTSYAHSGHYLNMFLNYRSYMEETQNNVFTYRLGDTISMSSRSMGNFDWDFGFGGQKFSEGATAYTETSFNNFYLETAILKTWTTQRNLDMSLEPAYQIKFFEQFENRVDHTISLNYTVDWKYQSDMALSPYAEFGLVFSNLSLYSRNYFEIGTDWQYLPSSDLKYVLRFLTRSTRFPNRSVSETTVISAGRGRTRLLSQDEIERHSFTQIQGSVAKMIRNIELKATLGFVSQSSLSGYENYSETQMTGSMQIPF